MPLGIMNIRQALDLDRALPCGHFIPEEAPDAVIAHFTRFLGAGA